MFSLEYELPLRLGFFFGIFTVMAVWELLAQRRNLTVSKAERWFNNISITFLNAAVVRVLFPILAVGFAYKSAENGWGFFNLFAFPELAAGIVCVIFLDFIIYLQHVVFHIVSPLWRLHMMHHTDINIDVTTGSRFHPIEICMSMVIKMAAVAVIGAPPWSVIAFEILLNGTAMFNHSNVSMPQGLDRIIRLFLVTPDMHRVHHSVIIKETNSNYGFNLPWWDRLFGTYRDQPVKGHIDMNIGLANFRNPGRLTLPWMLAIPFLGKER
jgi:sterol desaturase/sphingolipid hydroxylase (fatty acid hydroxylase superfamily)